MEESRPTSTSLDPEEVDVAIVPGALGSAQAARKVAQAAAADGPPQPDSCLSPAMRQWLTAFCIHMGYAWMGAIGYVLLEEDWTLVDAVYFTFTSISTVGYGCMTPSTIGASDHSHTQAERPPVCSHAFPPGDHLGTLAETQLFVSAR